MNFETVYTCPDWYDGCREGIADFQGKPHLFKSEWRDIDSSYRDSFLLSPLDAETFRLALEDWAIWLRWLEVFNQGRTPRDTHPALPEDRDRHEELMGMLKERLVIDPVHALRKFAVFGPQGVHWTDYVEGETVDYGDDNL
jgi:hypothetical protein